MISQERQLLQDFLNQLIQVPGIQKDPEADALITKALAGQPNATYLLVQRAMLMEQALNNAKAQIAQLQSQVNASSNNGGFLNSSEWGRPSPSISAVPQAQTSSLLNAAPQGTRSGFLSGGFGSFLGNVAATATGVAAGAFLFQGIESLLGHHGSGFLGQDNTHDLVENTTVNNYYADTPPSESLAKDYNDDSIMDSSFDDISSDDLSSI